MIIKVCGLREPGNIREVAAITGIDLIGLIFYAPSPRYVDSAETAAFVATLNNTRVAGVFVNETVEEVVAKCEEYRLDYIQLHGNESPDYLNRLRKKISASVKLIKAFSVRSEEDLQATSGYEALCEYFLFDTPTGGYGGSGKSFDWSILQHYKGSAPFLLSGGIGPDSLEPLMNFKHPKLAGLDLNSRFELKPGLKDAPLLSEFIQKIKSTRL
jgi:phosphoribosylanthranilate isomerase